MAATIQQIAEQAGVSASTVARVLRGDVKGAQKRSARNSAEILRICDELGYQPDWSARALSRGRTHSIGLLYSNPNWIFEDPMNEIAISFTQALKEHNYDLRLIPANHPDDWKELVLGGAVDGLAMLLHTPDNAREALEKSGLPAVLIGDKLDANSPHVLPDDLGGAYKATRHLIGLGHKHIVYFVDESIRPHVSVNERQLGFEKAMQEAGLGDRAEVWMMSSEEATDRLLSKDAPTAMLGYCHVEAMRIVQAAWVNGLAIPTDLSLIAFNDMTMTRYMTPPLTVVGLNTFEMGRRAAEMLVKQIESPEETALEDIVVSEELHIRGTTAPPSFRNFS